MLPQAERLPVLLTPWQQIDVNFSVPKEELNASRSWTPEVIGDWK